MLVYSAVLQLSLFNSYTFRALTLLVGWQEGHLACNKTEWWGGSMVVCLERCADLHMALLMPLPLTVFCFSKIEIGFTLLVPAYLGSLGKWDIKRMCVRAHACMHACMRLILLFQSYIIYLEIHS